MSLSITPVHLSFSKSLSSPALLFFSTSKLPSHTIPRKTTVIRMGGGPRTYPGGVSKWQWKRMQAKKAKQLLQARLCRERQIYEMRKCAELKAAVSELERPWEVVKKAPKLFSVEADEQLKALADRFQLPGGFDLWSDQDGPQLFKTDDGVPSARFFPKGVVHSIKPYGKVQLDRLESEDDDQSKLNGSEYEGNDSESEIKDNSGIRTTQRVGTKYLGMKGQRRGLHSTVGLGGKQRGGGEERELVHRHGGTDEVRISRGRGPQNLRDSGRGRSNGGSVSRGQQNVRDPGRSGSHEVRISRGRGPQNLRDSGRGGSNDGRVSRGLQNVRDPGRSGSDEVRISRGRGPQNLRDSGRGGSNDGRVTRGLRNVSDPGRGGSRDDGRIRRSRGLHNSSNPGDEVYEMSVQRDGSYEFQVKNEH